jgi:hypothetical protein
MRIELFRLLPCELIQLIWDKLSTECKATLNVGLYQTHHQHLYRSIDPRMLCSMHREVVRTDSAFVLKRILSEDGVVMVGRKGYRYGNSVFASYMAFLLDQARKHSADRCVLAIREYCESSGMRTNLPKNNRTKGTRWSN